MYKDCDYNVLNFYRLLFHLVATIIHLMMQHQMTISALMVILMVTEPGKWQSIVQMALSLILC